MYRVEVSIVDTETGKRIEDYTVGQYELNSVAQRCYNLCIHLVEFVNELVSGRK